MNDRRQPLTTSYLPLAGSILLVFLCGTAFLVGGVSERMLHWWPGQASQPAGLGPTFAEAWNLVEEHYVDPSAVQPARMTDGAITGMLASLGDTGHTGYLTAREFEQLTNDLRGEYRGIGARMVLREHQVTVVSTVPGSPAAGKLKPGDVLVEVGGKTVQGLSLQELVQLVRGPDGTTVGLRLLRQGKPIDLDIRRATFQVPNITARVLPVQHAGDAALAHVAIEDFGEHAGEELRKVLRQVQKEGARGLILDVRTDPGGERDQAVAVSGEFLKKGDVIFQQRNRAGTVRLITNKESGIAVDIPLCVLIDEGTASSAEILAAALKDHHRGPLVGTHTFGTGTVLQQFVLSDKSAVLLGVDEWLPPDGVSTWHKGVKPDVEVPLAEHAEMLLPETEEGLTANNLARSTDKQLLKAIDILTERLKKTTAAQKGSGGG